MSLSVRKLSLQEKGGGKVLKVSEQLKVKNSNKKASRFYAFSRCKCFTIINITFISQNVLIFPTNVFHWRENCK